MLLVDDKTQEIVTEQVNLYLSRTEFSFTTLKTLILSKAPIPQVHSKIVTTLNKAKQSSRTKVENALNSQALKRQLDEDKRQEKTDLIEEDKDNDKKTSLNRELKQIPIKMNRYENEYRTLERKLFLLIKKASQTQATVKKTNKNSLSHGNDPYSTAVERNRNALADVQSKINTLLQRQNTIHDELDKIESRSQTRKTHKHHRELRADARTGYQSTGEGIENTLSIRNKTALAKNIKDQHCALEKKYSELVQDAELINFPFFLEELQKYLDKPKHQLTASEVETLKSLLKLMLQHLELEHQVINIQQSLAKKKQFISSEIIKLEQLNNQLKSLIKTPENLRKENLKLKDHHLKLTRSKEKNVHLRQRMSNAALFLLVLSCALSIPLILALSGVIPFILTPALVYALVISPPSLSLLATIALGIAAVVFTYKTNADDTALKNNQHNINTNLAKAERSKQSMQRLQNITIPNLEVQIKKDESTRDQLITSLADTQKQSEQTLAAAKNLDPISFANASFLNSQRRSPLHQDEDYDTDSYSESDEKEANAALGI